MSRNTAYHSLIQWEATGYTNIRFYIQFAVHMGRKLDSPQKYIFRSIYLFIYLFIY